MVRSTSGQFRDDGKIDEGVIGSDALSCAINPSARGFASVFLPAAAHAATGSSATSATQNVHAIPGVSRGGGARLILGTHDSDHELLLLLVNFFHKNEGIAQNVGAIRGSTPTWLVTNRGPAGKHRNNLGTVC